MATKIEWTDETWNPIAGCNDVSEGCRNCYARRMAGRLEAMGVAKYAGLTVLQGSHRVWTGKISFDEKALLAPLEEDKPTRYFVNSMSDLFHENVTDEMRDRIFAVMALCPQHTFQVLTKRPERMLAYLGSACGRIADVAIKMRRERGDRCCVGPLPHLAPGAIWWPLANVQLGVSVEDQKTADERIPLLLQTPAAVRFISAEPLLGPIDLFKVPRPDVPYFQWRGETGAIGPKDEPVDYVYWMKRMLHWVIVGGESGPGARPMRLDWARSLRDQCVAAGVPFFFKQWGEWLPAMCDGVHTLNCSDDPVRVGKKAAGHLLDGKEWHQFPEVRA